MANLLKSIIKKETQSLVSLADGKIIRLENIPDHAFSNRLIGDGVALEISSDKIYAPCEGIIHMIASTNHAFTILLNNGAHILIHIGLYHDKPTPHNFHYHVKVGDYVTPETLILTLSENFLITNSYKIIIPIVVLNYHDHPIQTTTTSSTAKKGKKLFTCK